jgi:hypothetical protein
MPTSPYGHIEAFAAFLAKSRPSSILDIGLGNGKLGFVARDLLDVIWKQPAIYGNPYETHRSSWFFDDFKPFSCCHALFDYSAGPYGACLCAS